MVGSSCDVKQGDLAILLEKEGGGCGKGHRQERPRQPPELWERGAKETRHARREESERS
jgi:hypothetical protein